jgi:cell division protein FtsL
VENNPNHLQERAKKMERNMWIFVCITLLMLAFLWVAQKRITQLELELAVAKNTISEKTQQLHDFDMEAMHSVWWARIMPKNTKEVLQQLYEKEKMEYIKKHYPNGP